MFVLEQPGLDLAELREQQGGLLENLVDHSEHLVLVALYRQRANERYHSNDAPFMHAFVHQLHNHVAQQRVPVVPVRTLDDLQPVADRCRSRRFRSAFCALWPSSGTVSRVSPPSHFVASAQMTTQATRNLRPVGAAAARIHRIQLPNQSVAVVESQSQMLNSAFSQRVINAESHNGCACWLTI